ncbi:MAG: hypothetical protein R2755_26080 [Acidimicrobiales bacterium]
MDDDVHRVGDHQVGDLDRKALRGHRHVHLQAGEHAHARIGVDGAHRAVVALRHREHHRQHLGAADLADDHPVGLHPQTRAHQAVHGELADAFDVGFSSFEIDPVGVQGGEVVETDLEESSTVMMRSVSGTSLMRQRSSVVLPAPVPPATITLNRACTMARSRCHSDSEIVP